MKSVICRFAPSPTGFLHPGNLCVAALGFLFKEKYQGRYILRIEDSDKIRSDSKYIDNIMHDLAWAGITFNQIIQQSERQIYYLKAFDTLKREGLVYPCFCSPKRLQELHDKQRRSKQPIRYDGKCRGIENIKHTQLTQTYHQQCFWRFKVSHGREIVVKDLIKGDCSFFTNNFDDFIIRRSDASFLFLFCNLVDDLYDGITHVFRGDDHLPNTPKQLLIAEGLSGHAPQYGHIGLMHLPEGAILSKRSSALSVKSLEDAGYFPLALMHYLCADGIAKIFSTMQELSDHVSLKHFRAARIFNSASLDYYQKRYIKTHKEYMNAWLENLNLENIHNIDAVIEEVSGNIYMKEDFHRYIEYLICPRFESSVYNCLSDCQKIWIAKIAYIMISASNYSDFLDTAKQTDLPIKEIFQAARYVLTGSMQGIAISVLYNNLSLSLIQKKAHASYDYCS